MGSTISEAPVCAAYQLKIQVKRKPKPMRITLDMSEEETEEIMDLARRLSALEAILEELRDQLEDIRFKLEQAQEEQ